MILWLAVPCSTLELNGADPTTLFGSWIRWMCSLPLSSELSASWRLFVPLTFHGHFSKNIRFFAASELCSLGMFVKISCHDDNYNILSARFGTVQLNDCNPRLTKQMTLGHALDVKSVCRVAASDLNYGWPDESFNPRLASAVLRRPFLPIDWRANSHIVWFLLVMLLCSVGKSALDCRNDSLQHCHQRTRQQMRGEMRHFLVPSRRRQLSVNFGGKAR